MLAALHALNSATGLKQNRLRRYAPCKFNENLMIGRLQTETKNSILEPFPRFRIDVGSSERQER